MVGRANRLICIMRSRRDCLQNVAHKKLLDKEGVFWDEIKNPGFSGPKEHSIKQSPKIYVY